MQDTNIPLNSITWAIRAQKLLSARGIRSHIRKTTAHPGVNGCGYGLSVRGDISTARVILETAGIPVPNDF